MENPNLDNIARDIAREYLYADAPCCAQDYVHEVAYEALHGLSDEALTQYAPLATDAEIAETEDHAPSMRPLVLAMLVLIRKTLALLSGETYPDDVFISLALEERAS